MLQTRPDHLPAPPFGIPLPHDAEQSRLRLIQALQRINPGDPGPRPGEQIEAGLQRERRADGGRALRRVELRRRPAGQEHGERIAAAHGAERGQTGRDIGRPSPPDAGRGVQPPGGFERVAQLNERVGDRALIALDGDPVQPDADGLAGGHREEGRELGGRAGARMSGADRADAALRQARSDRREASLGVHAGAGQPAEADFAEHVELDRRSRIAASADRAAQLIDGDALNLVTVDDRNRRRVHAGGDLDVEAAVCAEDVTGE